MTAEEAQKIRDDYGAFLERNPPSPTRIEDVSKLPHPKNTILTAACLALVHTDDPQQAFSAASSAILSSLR